MAPRPISNLSLLLKKLRRHDEALTLARALDETYDGILAGMDHLGEATSLPTRAASSSQQLDDSYINRSSVFL
jgi:hypothetical protein